MNNARLSLRIVLLLTVFGIVSGPVYGKTTQWTGNTNTNWIAAGNWDNGVPEDNDTVQFDTSSDENLTTTCDISVTGITIEVINPSGNVSIDVQEISALGIAAIDMDSAQDDLTLASLITSFTISTSAVFDIASGRTITVEESIINGGNNLTVQGAGDLTFNPGGNFSGTGQLIMSGSGTITINTSTVFTGTLAINSGTVDLTTATNPLAAGDIDLNGGTLKLSQGINAANWIRTVDVIGSSAIDFNAVGSVIDGLITVSAAQVLTLQGGQAASITAGITGAGGLTLDMDANQVITVSTTGCDYTGDTTITSGNLTGGATNMLTDDGTYSLADDANALITLGGAETIGKLTGGGTTGGNIVKGTFWLTVTQGTDGTYGGAMSGTGGLIKAGAGKLTLTGNSGYTGNTTVSAGTLNMQHANAAGTTGAVTVSSGASLELEGGIAVGTKQLNLTGGGASNELVSVSGLNSWAGACSLQTATVDIVVSAGALTMSGIISGNIGTVDLVKSGAGELALTGDNEYLGDLVVNAGTCTLVHLDAFGAGDITLGGGTLKLGVAINADNWDPAITLTGSSAIDSDVAGSEIDQTINLNANTLTVQGDENIELSGVISGTGGVTTNMPPGIIVTLSAANTYSGPLTVTQGYLQLDDVDAFGTGAGGISLGNSALLDINVAIDAANWDPAITLTGGGAIYAGVAGSEIDQTINLNANNFIVFGSENIELSGVISGTGGVTIHMDAADDVATLSADNTYSGLLTVTEGVLILDHIGAFGTGAGGISLGGGTLRFGVQIVAANWDPAITLTGDAAIYSAASTSEIDEPINLNANTLTFQGISSVEVSSVISGTGGITVNMDAALPGVMLTGANTFSGLVTLTQGLLLLGHVDAFGTGAGGMSLGGGTLQLVTAINAANWDPAVTLTGDAAIDVDMPGSEIDQTINLNANTLTFVGDENLTLSGVISGTGGITENMDAADDVISLSAANSYSGTTVVDMGTLLVNAVQDNACNGAVTVANTAILGGTGTIKGAITVQDGGIVTPGSAGAGTLTTTTNVEFQGASKLIVDNVDASFDVLAVGGNLTLPAGTALIELEAGESYTTSNAVVTIAGYL